MEESGIEIALLCIRKRPILSVSRKIFRSSEPYIEQEIIKHESHEKWL